MGFSAQVDDESKPERRPSKHMRTPKEWDLVHNPAYAYYAYYVWVRCALSCVSRCAPELPLLLFPPLVVHLR